MFQYAFGRSIASSKGVPLVLDVSDYEDYKLHNGFELNDVFEIKAPLMDANALRNTLGWRGTGNIYRQLVRKRYKWLRGRSIFVEPHFHYCPDAFNVPSKCYLSGHWQSEKYFESNRDEIREDFNFKNKPSHENLSAISLITNSQSISVHIRRGDYINDSKTSKVHGTCTVDYYRESMELLALKISNPRFFIFSDDSEWAKSNIKGNCQMTFVDHNIGRESYNDMLLMSRCKHNILSNSTFSWWGAWLNNNPNKTVIAPRRWFATKNYNTADLLPDSWVVV